MADRKRVIWGLECCMREKNTNMCGDCPYHDLSETRFGCMQSAMRDSLALLKEQEPRVMTRKEIENSGGTEFYSEHKDEEYMYLDHTEGPAYIMGNMERLPLNRLRWGDYGRTWRCWTSRPTDKERRDTKWEEHNG